MSILKWLDKNFEYVCLTILLVIMTVLAFANVVLRYLLKSPLSWSDEVCCYCLALSAFIALPCSIRHRSAIRMDTLLVMLPKSVQKLLTEIGHVIMIVFLGFCVKGGLDITINAVAVNQKSPALQIPVSVLYLITTAFFALSILRSVQVLIEEWKTKEEA